MYINEEGYLEKTEYVGREGQLMDASVACFNDHQRVITKYKVNEEGLFEEVIEGAEPIKSKKKLYKEC